MVRHFMGLIVVYGTGAPLIEWHFGSRSLDPRKMGLGVQIRRSE
jgi:hypothetical protein